MNTGQGSLEQIGKDWSVWSVPTDVKKLVMIERCQNSQRLTGFLHLEAVKMAHNKVKCHNVKVITLCLIGLYNNATTAMTCNQVYLYM